MRDMNSHHTLSSKFSFMDDNKKRYIALFVKEFKDLSPESKREKRICTTIYLHLYVCFCAVKKHIDISFMFHS